MSSGSPRGCSTLTEPRRWPTCRICAIIAGDGELQVAYLDPAQIEEFRPQGPGYSAAAGRNHLSHGGTDRGVWWLDGAPPAMAATSGRDDRLLDPRISGADPPSPLTSARRGAGRPVRPAAKTPREARLSAANLPRCRRTSLPRLQSAEAGPLEGRADREDGEMAAKPSDRRDRASGFSGCRPAAATPFLPVRRRF